MERGSVVIKSTVNSRYIVYNGHLGVESYSWPCPNVINLGAGDNIISSISTRNVSFNVFSVLLQLATTNMTFHEYLFAFSWCSGYVVLHLCDVRKSKDSHWLCCKCFIQWSHLRISHWDFKFHSKQLSPSSYINTILRFQLEDIFN